MVLVEHVVLVDVEVVEAQEVVDAEEVDREAEAVDVKDKRFFLFSYFKVQ